MAMLKLSDKANWEEALVHCNTAIGLCPQYAKVWMLLLVDIQLLLTKRGRLISEKHRRVLNWRKPTTRCDAARVSIW